MRRLDNMIQELKRRDPLALLVAILEEMQADIVDMNTRALEERGEGSDGMPLEPPYRPLTVAIKQAKGQTAAHVTLKDTGDFHESFFVDFGAEGFTISATDWKTEQLTGKYGPAVFGLTETDFKKLRDIVLPKLYERWLT